MRHWCPFASEKEGKERERARERASEIARESESESESEREREREAYCFGLVSFKERDHYCTCIIKTITNQQARSVRHS
jgi:hypothetical protein